MKEKYLDDIKRINSIKTKKICSQLNINEKNMYNLRTTKENIKKVRDELIKELSQVIKEVE